MFDPYSYTQGRWLDQDAERRAARELRFDFDALLEAAVKSSEGAREVISCEKKEGGFNRSSSSNWIMELALSQDYRLASLVPRA